MGLLVQKFGGTSVGDLERIRHVANIVANTRAEGHQVVVVVSAMVGETDRLIDLAKMATQNPTPREFDALLATGEQVSAALLSMSLNNCDCPARSYTGSQVGIFTDPCHQKATIKNIETGQLRADLDAGLVPVITGFQGVGPQGEVTTIGRGGSDMTAVALAAALRADECQIFTDVDGVYTSDPRVVSDARRLAQITFDEMLELSSLGAKVFQLHAVEYANKHDVPVRVLSSFAPSDGTLITYTDLSAEVTPQVSGIAFDRNQAKITVLQLPNESSHIGTILNALNDEQIEVDMIVHNFATHEKRIDFSFTVHLDDFEEASAIIKRLMPKWPKARMVNDSQIAKLSLVGVGMTEHASAAAKLMQTLGERNIDIHLITSSTTKISVVIDEKYMELAARLLHAAFELHS